MMRVIPHRANQAFYAHHVTVLNVPTEQTARLRGHPLRDQILSRAVIEERYDLDALLEAVRHAGQSEREEESEDLEALVSFAEPEERDDIRKYFARLKELDRERRKQEAEQIAESADSIPEEGWLEALEYLNVHTRTRRSWNDLKIEREQRHPGRGVLVDQFQSAAADLGISDIQLVLNFPVVTAVFGYTRVSFEPTSKLRDTEVLTRFRGFSTPMTGPKSYKNRRPIFVDDSSTEALLFKLRPTALLEWLRRRGHDVPNEASAGDETARAWLLRTFRGVDTFVTFKDVPDLTRDAFTLIHTYAHLTIRALSRISGIERTGLAEYLFPRIGTFIIYNTKAGRNLGGLNTVYSEMQDRLLETLGGDVLLKTCVYDPLCISDWRASCHACTHLAEMSCKHYNRGLSRIVLYGQDANGPDAGFFATI
jgi:hypothetical protein